MCGLRILGFDIVELVLDVLRGRAWSLLCRLSYSLCLLLWWFTDEGKERHVSHFRRRGRRWHASLDAIAVRAAYALPTMAVACTLSLLAERAVHTPQETVAGARAEWLAAIYTPYTRPRNARTLSLYPQCTRGYPVRYRVPCDNNATNT